MQKRDFLTLLDRSKEEIIALLNVAIDLKKDRNAGKLPELLKNKTLAMIFEKSSTRTRISFEVGIKELGGFALFLSSKDIQLGRGETIEDTAHVLSRYAHAIMIRTFGHDKVETLAKNASIPIINALTDSYHPCQVLADMQTMAERFSMESLTNGSLKVAYVGDGNNMAHSWLNAAAVMGFSLAIASPKAYTVQKDIYENAYKLNKNILLTESPKEACKDAHVIYTDVFASMGMESESEKRLKDFQGYQVTDELMKIADKKAIFMHCLPAHRGEEVAASVIDGPQSAIFDEAENRLHAQKAVLIDTMYKPILEYIK